MMRADDVWYVLDLLDTAGIHVWVDGGWGVDALLGVQTRDHDDLDLAMEHVDVERYRDVMTEHGFRASTTAHSTPRNFVMIDDAGRVVDMHLVDTSVVVSVPDGIDVYGPNGLAYEVGSLTGRGTIDGRTLACCTADFQVRSHTGYEHDAEDERDVRALCERFAIELPAQYASG